MQYGSTQEMLGGQVYYLPNNQKCIFLKGIFAAGQVTNLPSQLHSC